MSKKNKDTIFWSIIAVVGLLFIIMDGMQTRGYYAISSEITYIPAAIGLIAMQRKGYLN